MSIRVDVHGVSDALRELRSYDKQMYKQITAKMANTATGLAAQVGSDFPDKALTRWKGTRPKKRRSAKKPFPTYPSAAVRGGVKPKVGVGRVVEGKRTILRIQQMTAGGAVFDSAGSRTDNLFVKNLDTYAPTKGTSRVGQLRSRVLYKAVEKRQPQVEDVVVAAVRVTDKIVQSSINS